MNTDPLNWARQEAHRLRAGGVTLSRGSLAPAIDYLRAQAGPRSAFTTTAEGTIGWPPDIAGTTVADLLDGWVSFRLEGFAQEAPFEVRSRVEASTDLLEQVDVLLEDNQIHPAAPVMLVGAALEEFLRSMVETLSQPYVGKPNIEGYTNELHRQGLIDKQARKDVTAWGGRRNDAAHGHFDKLNIDLARLMAEGIKVFIRDHAPSVSK